MTHRPLWRKIAAHNGNAALDTGGVTIKYGITQVDSTVVLDSTGNIVLENIGPPGYQPLRDALAKVVMYILWRLNPVLISAGAVAFSKSMRLCYDSNLHIVFC